MNNLWSQSEEAFRDTLVHKSEADAMARLCSLYGFEWPPSINEAAWRGAFNSIAYGPRDTFPVVFEALEKALSQYTQTRSNCQYKVGSAAGIYHVDGWLAEYIGRYIRIGDDLYYSVGVSGGGDEYLELSPYATSYWSGAAFSVLADTDIDRVEILPFMTWERSPGPTYEGWGEDTYDGLSNTLEVEVWPHLGFVPESYLLEPTEYLTATQGACPVDGGDVCTPATTPNGGYLLYSDTDDYQVEATVAAGSDGDELPQATINVDTTDYFESSGDLYIMSTDGLQIVTYTSKTGTTFDGCTGGTGTLAEGDAVYQTYQGGPDDLLEAYPVYLYDGDVARELRIQFNRLLAAGNWLELYATNRLWGAPTVTRNLYYSSPGASGDYVQAANAIAANAVFSGAVPTATVLFWYSFTSGQTVFAIGDPSTDPSFTLDISVATPVLTVRNNAGALGTVTALAPISIGNWSHAAIVANGATVELYTNGVASGTPLALAGAYASSDAFIGMAALDANNFSVCDLRNIAVFTRALSATEVDALFSAGKTHDVRASAAGWAGEQAAIYYAGPDQSGDVPNYGYLGDCALTLAGDVSLQED